MRVYVVIYRSFEGASTIKRIFDNEDRAKTWADKHNEAYDMSPGDDDMYIVQEHEVQS